MARSRSSSIVAGACDGFRDGHKESFVRIVRIAMLMLTFTALVGRPALAQSRPLATEDPETVPAGNILFEAGLDYAHDTFYPASGLRGNLWRVGTFGASF